jgi:hypothetical protein
VAIKCSDVSFMGCVDEYQKVSDSLNLYDNTAESIKLVPTFLFGNIYKLTR